MFRSVSRVSEWVGVKAEKVVCWSETSLSEWRTSRQQLQVRNSARPLFIVLIVSSIKTITNFSSTWVGLLSLSLSLSPLIHLLATPLSTHNNGQNKGQPCPLYLFACTNTTHSKPLVNRLEEKLQGSVSLQSFTFTSWSPAHIHTRARC